MVPAVLLGLLEDGCLSVTGSVAQGLAAHHDLTAGPYAPLLGPMRLPDSQLAEVGRQVGEGTALPVCALNTTGAGGLVSLAGRPLAGVRLGVVETALRDLDNLTGNAARVVAAAGELEESDYG